MELFLTSQIGATAHSGKNGRNQIRGNALPCFNQIPHEIRIG